MGHVTPDQFNGSNVPRFSSGERVLGNGLLSLEYCVSGPSHCGPRVEERHCLVVPVQADPIRSTIIRNRVVQDLTLRWGDIALAPAGTEVTWQWHDPAKVVLIWISPDGFQRFIEQDMRLILHGNSLENEIVVNDPDLTLAACRMRDAILSQDVGTDIVFEAQARVFLVILVRHYGLAVDQSDTHAIGQQHFDQITGYLDANLDQKVVLSDLARLVGMSDAVFSRRFKEKLGKTPMRFVSEYRLGAAARLMMRSELNFGQIALRCGFSDQAHLTRTFRKIHAMTPRQYRSRLLKRPENDRRT